LFTEEGKDDYLYMEQYVMLGNFQRDPDRFEMVEQQVRDFVGWADGTSEEARQFRVQREVYEEHLAELEALRSPPEEGSASRRFFGRSNRPVVPATFSPQVQRQIEDLKAQLEQERVEFERTTTTYLGRLDRIMSASENAAMLVDYFQTDRIY